MKTTMTDYLNGYMDVEKDCRMFEIPFTAKRVAYMLGCSVEFAKKIEQHAYDHIKAGMTTNLDG